MKPAGWLLAVPALAVLAACAPSRLAVGTPLEALSPQLTNGRDVFMANCQECHPAGAAGLGPSLNDKPLPAFAIMLQVRAGFGAMPAFGPDQISDRDLLDLTGFLEELQRRARR